MPHVRRDYAGAIIARGFGERFGAVHAGGELCAEVGKIAVGIARWVAGGRQQNTDLGLAKMALVDQQLVVDQTLLFVLAVGRIEPGVSRRFAWCPRAGRRGRASR